ncbi:mechanosensitive ion channel family protein [Sediminispirochaeta smaragdinae]|uniref:MscS Mechanosensitive ion channel n=1 Tax=Sediminispirochaeta smaragdinae (strain DSM 11293 / JCM 15392 / SEBR 4228) TaxID=573413 RepID=E1R3W3_SEDSS|nr:mechanosensitive ion channel family protein [Sediminispirochaeta smaragdinae]ADK82084.1 MscS Mechanosensitive ion channel [Sediminispirochaeta smaragdinae DSM 11293]
MTGIDFDQFLAYFTADKVMHVLRIFLFALAFYLLVRMSAVIVRRTLTKNASEQSKVLIHKMIIYTGVAVILIVVLDSFGVNLSALLGAAGVLGVALGIASQKSLGNVISGLFLVSDRTFEVGDAVKIGSFVGVVHSLDLLSVKLRTFDNTFIRIPNDQIISTEITNITRFPIRRMDFNLRVAYSADIELARDLLLDIAEKNPLCLREPEPFFLCKEFSSSGIEFLFAIWFEKSSYVAVKNSVFLSIRQAFAEHDIEIPVMQVKVWYPETEGRETVL